MDPWAALRRFSGAFAAWFLLGPLIQAHAVETATGRDVMVLLRDQCLSCHNPEKKKGGLSMHSKQSLLQGGRDGKVIDLDVPEASPLLKALEPDADPHMPPNAQLSKEQRASLKQWITEGLAWDDAALAPARPPRQVKFQPVPESYQPCLAMACAPDGHWLAVGRGERVTIYDLSLTNYPVATSFKAHQDTVRSLAWSPDSRWLISGAFRELSLWDTNGFTQRWKFSGELHGHVTAIRFSSYGGAILAADSQAAEGGWIQVIDTASGQSLGAWQAHADSINDLVVSPDGGVVASAGGDKLVKLWELVSKREISRLEGHAGSVTGIAFNTNGTELVSVSADKQLKLWNLKTRESILAMTGRKHGFNGVTWSSDGQTVFAVDDDGHAMSFSHFKPHTGEQSSAAADERQLGHWSDTLHCVAVSSDGKTAFAGSQEGAVYVVDEKGRSLASLRGDPVPRSRLDDAAPSFVHDVLPLLSKAGCSAGACHAKPEGQNGFKLSVFNFDPKSDFGEITREGRGRRVFPAAPEESLLLLKPTLAVAHGGGQRFQTNSLVYETVVRWIRAGMIYQHTNEASVVRLRVDPHDAQHHKGTSQALRVTAEYSDGSARDVTELAHYAASDKEIASVDDSGVVHIGQVSGESAIVARFMGLVDAARVTVPADRLLESRLYAELARNNFIDDLAWRHFEKLGLFPSGLCTDAEFIRRSSLDAIGVLPTAEEARQFLCDPDPLKREHWIDSLLSRPAYADFWANKWADLLRPNPDRVGVKSVFVLDQWLRESFRQNKPYDQFVREILLAQGSNHRDGPVVIYRDRREPSELTTMFSQVFLGVRMECARCHHHPNEKWSQDDFYQFAAFFGPLKQKGAGLSPPISAGNETFYYAPGGTVKHPLTDEVMKPKAPDGPVVEDTLSDPRRALADWLTAPSNPFFARAAVNRVWAALFGRGFVEPVDDFRISNPVMNEPLLDALAADFKEHQYDLHHLIRTILQSRLYQLSSIPNESNRADTKNFSRSLRRRLPAEVLLDAVNDVTGVYDSFNGMPPGSRAMETWSYKISSHFLDAFGRPNSSSDCPCERDARASVVQALHLMNSKTLQSKLASSEGRVAQWSARSCSPNEIVTDLYFAAFSRPPGEIELSKAVEAFTAPGATRRTATEDVLWALLNSAEFVFNH